MLLEKVFLKRQTKQSLEAKGLRSFFQGLQQRTAETSAFVRFAHGERPDLAEVFPEHVQSTATDDFAAHFNDDEFLDRFKEHHQLFAQQNPLVDERFNDPPN